MGHFWDMLISNAHFETHLRHLDFNYTLRDCQKENTDSESIEICTQILHPKFHLLPSAIRIKSRFMGFLRFRQLQDSWLRFDFR